MEIKQVPAGDLKPSDYNPRKWDEKTLSDMRESLTRFGLVDPIIANSAPARLNVVIGGHLRLKVAKSMGLTEVPVAYVDIPDVEREKELNLRLNKNLGSWDEELLKLFDTGMLLDAGFTPDDLNSIFDDALGVAEDGFDVNKELAAITKPETKPGDLYQLGGHRLLCGDSLDPDDVKKLMGAEKARMIYCDPPYNIGLDYRKGVGTGGKYTPDRMVDDGKKDVDYEAFVSSALRNALAASLPDAHVFFWCDERYVWLVQQLYAKQGVANRRLCLWVKDNFDPTPQVAFNKVIETCAYGTLGSPPLNPSLRNATEIMNQDVRSPGHFDDLMALTQMWLVRRDPTADYEHPTQKPVTLGERPIRRCTAPGDLVLDLFGGSGSTLIAAEQMKRRAFLMEMDPTFCDVIVKRYERLTGDSAKRVK